MNDEMQRARKIYNDKEKRKKFLIDLNVLLQKLKYSYDDLKHKEYMEDMKNVVVLLEVENEELQYKLKEKLCFEGNEQFKELNKELETYKKTAEYLARVVIASEYSFLSVEELIDWVREKVEKE